MPLMRLAYRGAHRATGVERSVAAQLRRSAALLPVVPSSGRATRAVRGATGTAHGQLALVRCQIGRLWCPVS